MSVFFSQSVIISGVIFLCAGAHANTTVLTISANILASPCTVPSTMSIVHQDVYVDKIAQVTPYRNDQLTLTACPYGTSTVTATFTGTPDSTNGVLYKNSGTAKGIAIQLVQSNTGKSFSNGQSISFSVSSDRTATIGLASRLIVTDSTKLAVGTVLTTVNVTFSYS